MKLLNKFRPAAIIATCLITTAVFASQAEDQDSDYTITLMKDCQVVSEVQMTDEQVDAYLALKKQEKVMESLQNPIDDIEQELNEYTKQIEELTALAIQDTDDSLYIDKNYLAEQKEVVEKLNALMKIHQKDFDAIGQQGSKIGNFANKFTQLLEVNIGNIDYDHIRVNSPNEEGSTFHCYSNNI